MGLVPTFKDSYYRVDSKKYRLAYRRSLGSTRIPREHRVCVEGFNTQSLCKRIQWVEVLQSHLSACTTLGLEPDEQKAIYSDGGGDDEDDDIAYSF